MTTKGEKRWTAEYFSQANPAGPGQDDVPSLLRRFADSLDRIGPVEVQDLILETDVTADGYWPSLTVYFHRLRAKPAKKRKAAKSRTSK